MLDWGDAEQVEAVLDSSFAAVIVEPAARGLCYLSSAHSEADIAATETAIAAAMDVMAQSTAA